MTTERRSSIPLYVGAILLLAAAGGGVEFLFHSKVSQAREEVGERQADLSKGPKVQVELAKRTPPERVIIVQAEARPFAEVTLYAKVAGYLREIDVDKGDKVVRGQRLARIEAPELDAQVVAAMADAKYKQVNAKRADALVAPGVVSAQDRDVAVSSAEVAAATQRSVEMQKGYELLRAPFDGTITARFADPGALLQNAANAQSGALPIVTVSQVDTLRIYGYVDQRDAAFVRNGDPVEIRRPERPQKTLPATVTRSSGELDPRTRMMLVEVDYDNRKNTIVAGSFVDLMLHLTIPSAIDVPAAALLVRNRQPFVAVIDAQNKVHLKPVELAEDDGLRARIITGVDEGDRVAINLGDGVADGATVQPIQPGADLGKPK